MTEFKETELDERAIKMAKVLSADAVEKAGSGHPGSPVSLAPVAYTLYQHFIKHDPNDPNWEGRDRFILSGGHASLTQYVQLYFSGYGLTLDDLKNFRGGDKKAGIEVELADKIYAHLEAGKPARTCPVTDEEKEVLDGWFLLTTKPVIYAANIAEEDLGKPESEIKGLDRVEAIAKSENAEIIVISAAIEEEIAQMSPDEKAEFIEGLGIGQSGLDRLITACYRLLGLISFLTAGEDECRAWTIVNGTKAPQAAGKIHTDFEKGFIRAEIVPFDTLVELGSMAACKEKGLVRSEGKDYVMKDGDIVLFRFNV